VHPSKLTPAPGRGADLLEIRRGPIAASVLHDDELHVVAAMLAPGVDTLPENIEVVEGRHDDAERRNVRHAPFVLVAQAFRPARAPEMQAFRLARAQEMQA
jgi:hypothetical protein